MSQRPIGVFDSSVGGISVLTEMLKLMPNEQFIYYGDTLNAPYGVREEEDILRLTSIGAEKLLQMGIKALVIACNTATSAAAEALRAKLDIPVIGMEPALKPAAEHGNGGLILVMATPATLRQKKFQLLYSEYGRDAKMVPCEGLMEFAERGELDSEALHEYLTAKLTSFERPVEAVVLGCTHYVFLKRAIRKVLPGVQLFDGHLGTARRVMHLLDERGELERAGEGGVTLLTTGDERVMLPLMRRLMEIDIANQ